MGEPLSRTSPTPELTDYEDGALEVTGIRRRERGISTAAPIDRQAMLLWLRPEGSGQRSLRLGTRPLRRAAWLCTGWLCVMLGLGAGLRIAVGPAPASLRLPWAQARASRGHGMRLSGWARMPEARLSPEKPGVAAQRAVSLGLGSRPVASQLLRGEVEASWMAAAARLGRAPTRFLWPVARGWFVRGFGSGTGGYHLAVDVAGEEGSTVRAAADGVVAYADDGVRGYGNLLLLVHAGGFVTMYAHNQTHVVEVGEFVPAGAPIATLGNTGISRGPHVHFELIHDKQNCDPVPLFEPGVRHRERGFEPASGVRWEDGRPREVRCARRRKHPHSRWGVDDPLVDAAPAQPSEPMARVAEVPALMAGVRTSSAGQADDRGNDEDEARERRREERAAERQRARTRERSAETRTTDSRTDVSTPDSAAVVAVADLEREPALPQPARGSAAPASPAAASEPASASAAGDAVDEEPPRAPAAPAVSSAERSDGETQPGG